MTKAEWESHFLIELDRHTGDKRATESIVRRWDTQINFARESKKMPIDTARDVYRKHLLQVQRELERRLKGL